MRPLTLGDPPLKGSQQDTLDFIFNALREIENSSYEDVSIIADNFTVSNVTISRTLDPTTATLSQLAHFVGTFVQDIKRRGAGRVE